MFIYIVVYVSFFICYLNKKAYSVVVAVLIELNESVIYTFILW